MDGGRWPRVSKKWDCATVQSRKNFQRLHKIWVCEHKNPQFTYVLPFLGHFFIFLLVFGLSCLQNFLTEILVAQKNTFRKSEMALASTTLKSSAINKLLYIYYNMSCVAM